MFEIIVATIITKKGKVLMVKEQKESVKGLLNFPAGRLEQNETLSEGAKREVKEETGLDVEIIQLLDVQYFSKNDRNFVSFVFKGAVKKDSKIDDNELDYKYYEVDYLKKNQHLLRSTFILPALENLKKGSRKALNILK